MNDNPHWRRETGTQRKAAERAGRRWFHLAVEVWLERDDLTGIVRVKQTKKGKGKTYRKLKSC